MEDTYVQTNRPLRGSSVNWVWILMLPLFFVLGWFANDAVTRSGSFQAEPGVGGAPFVEKQGGATPTVTPQPTLSNPNENATPEPSVSPTDSPLNQ